MSRKLLLFFLVPAVLLTGGYLFLQFYLRSDIRKEESSLRQAAAADSAFVATDSLGGKKTAETDLRPLFIDRLKLLLKKSSNGLYDLSIADLKVDVLASKISLVNVTVKPDEKAYQRLKAAGLLPPSVFTISLPRLEIDGVNLDDAITSKTMDYRFIKLVQPVIHIERGGKKQDKNNEPFAQNFLKEMEKLSVNKLVVENGTIIVSGREKGEAKKLNRVQVWMNAILLDSTTRTDKDRFLFAREARLQFSDYSTKTKDGLYNFRIGNVSVNTIRKSVTLTNLTFKPTLNKEAFMKKTGVAKERFDLSFPGITVSGIDWWSALNEEEIIAKEIKAKGGKLAVYFDRRLPPKNKLGNFPNQLVKKLPLKLAVTRLMLQDMDISYEEYNPLSGQSGTVYFDKAFITISNINNTGSNTPMVVDGKALFMDQVPMKARFRFDMNRAKTGTFTATVQADKPFDASLLNPVAMPLGMVKVENGELQKLTAAIKGDEQQAGSEVLVLYKDLKLSLLEKDSGKEALDKKNVTSFIANLFVLKKENPKGDNTPRKEQGQFQRDPTGGFMMLVWKAALVGILKSIGAPEKMAQKKGK